jgi:hypothetical protein
VRGTSAAVPVAPVTPRVCAPIGIPTWMPGVRIPRSAPPEPNARSDVAPDARSGSAPPIRSAPVRVSIGRRQSKSDTERQDESREKLFHAGVNAQPRRGIPSRAKNQLERALPPHRDLRHSCARASQSMSQCQRNQSMARAAPIVEPMIFAFRPRVCSGLMAGSVRRERSHQPDDQRRLWCGS